jgi:peptidoglycan/xylan/chitin deacetylase (PgdA/CDA1 family)
MSDLRHTLDRLIDRVSDRLTDRLMRHVHRPRIEVPTQIPYVSFTFDDVPDTALTNGARILENHGVRGTFYIAGGLMGRVEPDRRLIDAEGCRALAAAGHELGSHTFAHPKVRHLSPKTIAADLDRNDAFLDAIDGGTERRNFAYPYNVGSFPARNIFADRFVTARAGGERINRGPVNPAFLYSVEIRQPESHAQGLVRWIDDVAAAPGWLIFFTHDIAATPTPFGCTPETFEMLVSHAVTRGCTILPVRDVLARFRLDAAHAA